MFLYLINVNNKNIMKYNLKVMKEYATFSGRARRKEYWMFQLFNLIIAIIWGVICGITGFPDLADLYSLVIILPSLAVGMRRMHDVGKSGWFILIPVYSFILAVSKGEEKENEYGKDPKANQN